MRKDLRCNEIDDPGDMSKNERVEASMQTETKGDQDQISTLRDRAWANAGLVTSGFALVLTSFRLMGIAHYNLSSTLGVLGAASTSAVVLGAAVLFLPYAATMAVNYIATNALFNTYKNENENRLPLNIYWGSLTIALLTFPWMTFLAMLSPLVLWSVANIVKGMRKKPASPSDNADRSWLTGTMPSDVRLRALRELHNQLTSPISPGGFVDLAEVNRIKEQRLKIIQLGNARLDEIKSAALTGIQRTALLSVPVVILPVAQYIFANDRPWMPSELFQFASKPPYVGYVLRQDPKWITTLSQQDRQIVYINVDEVKGREICSIKSADEDTRPIIRLMNPQVTYKECPK